MIYNKEVEKVYVPLEEENESYLYNKMISGDQSARQTIIYSCLPLVSKIARRFHENNKSINLEDMIQEGNIALIRAVDNWDISKAKITTVATWYVTNAIIDMIQNGNYGIKHTYSLTKQASRDIAKIRKCESNEIDTIAKETGLTKKRVKRLLPFAKEKRVDFSMLNFKIGEEERRDELKENNTAGCLADLIENVELNIKNEVDKKVFLCWIKNIKSNNKTRLVAKETGIPYNEVYDIVKRVKKEIKGFVNA